MVEILLVLLLISLLVSIFGMPLIIASEKKYLGVVDVQLEAMATCQTKEFQQGISFNHKGNINMARTITINGYNCVFQLGMGRYYCE